jgi:hypothetical protein
MLPILRAAVCGNHLGPGGEVTAPFRYPTARPSLTLGGELAAA